MQILVNDIGLLYDRYSKRLFRTSLRILGDRADAEEAMHDTLLRFARTKNVPEMLPQVEAWLQKTCVRISIDRLRRDRKFRKFFDDIESPSIRRSTESAEEDWNGYLNDPEEEVSDRIGRIKTGIASLAAGYRVILSLHLFEGYDYDEIAAIIGIKVSTVRSQYVRAKMKLLEKLKENGRVEKIH